jgi:hypothetical protein
MACLNRMFARMSTSGGWVPLVLVLVLAAAQVYAQVVSPRMRGGPDRDLPDPSAASPQPTPAEPAPAQPVPAQPSQSSALVSQVAPSMLQQPAGEAQIVFTGDTLSIRADNSSLSAILHQVASKSGMQIDGLSGDERVFGSFGPGAPRDVLADLLNGTAYNLVLLGDLGGAPRELILTPATRAGGAAPPPAPTATNDEAANEPEAEVPPPPDVPPAGTTPPPTPGVKTPQQLFEQLQRMRSAQQQQVTTPQDPQQQQQQQQPQQ